MTTLTPTTAGGIKCLSEDPSLSVVVVAVPIVVVDGVVVVVVRRGAGALGPGRLHVVGQVVGVLKEEVLEDTQLFAEQFDLGLQPLILLLELVYALLRVLGLLLAAHAALFHRQVIALTPLPVLVAVLVRLRLLHLAGWRGLASSCGAYGYKLGHLL